MRPFSALKFFKENKRKAVVSFVVLIFTVCAISLITCLINSLTGMVTAVNLQPFKYFSVVSSVDGEYFLKDTVVEKLKANKDIEKLLPVDIGMTSIKLSIGGNTSVPVSFMSKSGQQYLMDKMGDYVSEGHMPADGTNEIAVHWRIMANKKWKIGDTIGSFKDSSEALSGKYKIVGKIDGPSIVVFGAESYKQEQFKKQLGSITKVNKPMAYLVFPKEGQREKINQYLNNFDKTQVSTYNYDEMKKQLDDVLAGLNSTIIFIILIVIFILSISVGALMYVIYIQRSDEFGIMYAMGYRRKFIKTMIVKEIMSLNFISWIVGLIFTFGIITLLNALVYNPKGDILNMFAVNVFLYTFIIPIMVGLFSILPIAMRLRKWDPVAVIERRD
jgi:putative ABC transport system permease protein